MPNRRTAAGSLALSLALAGGVAALPAGAEAPIETAPAAPATVSRQVDVKATLRTRPQGSAFVGRGTFTGKPFTSGKIRTRGSVLSGRPFAFAPRSRSPPASAR